MTDKKLTDTEITVKALKEILELMLCEGDLQRISTISHTIDLINRLQARVEKAEKVEHFADKTIATLQTENERLEKDNKERWSIVEAYKEFAERFKKIAGIYQKDTYVIGIDEFDNLLKEMVGEDNG